METDRVRHHFRVQVPEYPGLMKRLIPFYDDQREIILRLMPLNSATPLKVLDLGCGPGLMAEKILSAYRNARLTAFDLTEEMLTACRERLGPSERVSYKAGDFRCDPLGTGYDVIVASLSLHHLLISERPNFSLKRAKALTQAAF